MSSLRPELASGGGGPTRTQPLQTTGMLSREQLLQLFHSNTDLLDRPDVKKRLLEAVRAGREAAAATTELQEELLHSMGIDPKFGIQCLGRVNDVYKNDRELMLKFYEFVSREELACDEAELLPDEYQEKLENLKSSNEQQLEMLYQLRRHPIEQQRILLQQMAAQLKRAQASPGGSMSSIEFSEFFGQSPSAKSIETSSPMSSFTP
eukprot:TRINITY_DN20996_c0_g1_i1.p1 TRINITY_DN20996_c0_g1~~TRINITY_DN20996_c0_g1_i1.p1  ORF type:complete len:207 (+),score=46.76 TRINITY_DN20996_c0_g1_i1:35-655(+)